jgi:iron complex outermembrane receptor protein
MTPHRTRHRRPARSGIAAFAFSALAQAAAAQTAPVETIVISGSGAEQRAFDTPYAVDVVDAQELRSAGPMVNLSEALQRVPGLVVNMRNNYAQDLQISSRGFGARASFGVRGMRLYSDGIPAAGPDGQGQVSHFDIAGASRIEVLRGPFSALYGNGSGGVISLVTRAPQERRFEFDADAGSAGLRQLRVGVEAPLTGGFNLRASLSGFQVDGFRPQSSARRTLGNLRLGYDGAADHVVVVLNAIDQPADDPLGLTRAQFDADPDQTTGVALPQDAPGQPNRYNTRKNTTQSQAGVQWRHDFDDAGALQRSAVAVYGGRRSVTQWQSIPVSTQNASPNQPGGVIDFDRRYAGVDARLFFDWEHARLVTGASLDRQQEDRRGNENFIGSGADQLLGVTGALRRDEDNLARSRDVYAQGEIDLPANLSLSAGLRHGVLKIASNDHFLSNGDDSGALDYSYTNPVAALRWQAASDWNLYLSSGRGYESPTLNEMAYRPDGRSGFNTDLRAQRSHQWELGSKWRDRALGLALDVALFRADTSDEIGVQTNTGGRSTYQNVGRTSRHGAEVDLRWQITPHWRTQVTASVLDATYRDGFFTCAGAGCAAANVRVPAGNRIAGTLPRSGFAELVWSPGATEFGIEAHGQGRQPVNDLNSDFAGGYGLLALRAAWRVPLGGGRLELLARVDNVADRRVAGSVIVNEGNQRFFEPNAGRNFLLSARFSQAF